MPVLQLALDKHGFGVMIALTESLNKAHVVRIEQTSHGAFWKCLFPKHSTIASRQKLASPATSLTRTSSVSSPRSASSSISRADLLEQRCVTLAAKWPVKNSFIHFDDPEFREGRQVQSAPETSSYKWAGSQVPAVAFPPYAQGYELPKSFQLVDTADVGVQVVSGIKEAIEVEVHTMDVSQKGEMQPAVEERPAQQKTPAEKKLAEDMMPAVEARRITAAVTMPAVEARPDVEAKPAMEARSAEIDVDDVDSKFGEGDRVWFVGRQATVRAVAAKKGVEKGIYEFAYVVAFDGGGTDVAKEDALSFPSDVG
jgi:hypothetical protein